MSQCVTQCALLSKHLCSQMFIARNRWSCSGPLASATSSIFDPHWVAKSVRALCGGDPAALVYGLRQFTDRVDVGVGRLKAMDLGLGGS